MRHVTLGAISALIVVCLALSLVPTGLSATTWLTTREDVSFASGTVDIDVESVNQTVDALHTATCNVTLPCNLTNLNQTLTVFRINTSGTNVSFNLTVNGVDVNASSPINWTMGNWSNVTLAMVIAAGVDPDDTYMNVSTNANDTATVYGRIYADDAPLTTAWLTANIVVKEKDVTLPYIDTTSSLSFFTVNDSINVSNSVGFTLSDVNLTPTFSSQTITAPATYYNIGTLTNGSSTETYAQYQKHGPFIHDVDEESSATSSEHEVTITIQSYELFTDCVYWSIITSDDFYDGAFDDINYNTLEVTLNGNEIDWEEGSIEMEELDIQEAYSQNEFVFSWTSTIPYVPPIGTEAWYMMLFLGIALYMWLVIVVILVVIILFIMMLKKK